MSIILDALNAVRQWGLDDKNASRFKILSLPPQIKSWGYEHNGEKVIERLPEGPINVNVSTLDDFYATYDKYKGVGTGHAVYVNEGRVTLYFKDEYNYNTISMSLITTNAIDHLFHTCRCRLSQQELIEMLSGPFSKSDKAKEIVSAVSNLEWNTTDSTRSTYARDGESLGNKITSQVASDKEIPSSFTVPYDVFLFSDGEGIDTSGVATVELKVLTREHLFTLQTDRDALVASRVKAIKAIRNKIRENMPGVTVVCGGFSYDNGCGEW